MNWINQVTQRARGWWRAANQMMLDWDADPLDRLAARVMQLERKLNDCEAPTADKLTSKETLNGQA